MFRRRVTRRSVLSASAAWGSTVAIGTGKLEAKSYSGQIPWSPGTANAPGSITAGPFQFFAPDEVAFIDAAVSRLIPDDELGPGAKQAGVTVFLDRQLAGPYGRAEDLVHAGAMG